MIHLLLHACGFGVVEHEQILLPLGVLRHVQVLVLVEESLHHAVVAYRLQTHLALRGQILFHRLHLKQHFLGED